MKTAAEAIGGTILNGGFSIFEKKCGHKGDINEIQWQDLYSLLVSLHEVLLKCAVKEYCCSHFLQSSEINAESSDAFWTWVGTLRTGSANEVCCFWMQMLLACLCWFFCNSFWKSVFAKYYLKNINRSFFAYARDMKN